MKSWLRARKSDAAAPATAQGPLPPIDIKSIPVPQNQHHKWDALTGSAAASVSEAPADAARSPAHGVGKPTTKQLVDAAAARIAAEPLAHQQHILVRSEHYFRLVLESWEQLRACHFKASQKFSLAEWMHIHALLLYGRIQAVRRLFTSSAAPAVVQQNRIDLSADVAVFDPLATLLNTIGVVQDKETGVTYVPDALFPAEAYSASEMQHILDGTMFDWQRSWKRVLEARHLRDTKYTQFALVRSSSELIFAIREKTELIARLQRGPQPRRDSIVLDDYKHELDELHELLEEARNAKDYTMRPPCVRLYDRDDAAAPSTAALNTTTATPPHSQPRDSPSLDPRAFRRRPAEPDALDARATGSPARASLALDFTLESCPLERTNSSEPSESSSEPSSVETLSPLDAEKQAGSGSADVLAELPAAIELPASMKLPALPMLSSRPDDKKPPAPLRSAMRKGSATLLQDLSSRASPLGPLDGSLMNIANSSDTTLQSKGRAKEFDAVPQAPVSPTKLAPKRGHRVQLAGAADASDCFVHFDARIWEEYQAFVDALQSTRLITFGRLKKELDGSYAWMLPVKMRHDRQSPGSSPASAPAPTLQGTPLMSTPLRHQELQIRLPRTSIPRSEQALALLLQTSSLPPEIGDSWHVETRAALDMRRFVLEYVNTGIFDSRAM